MPVIIRILGESSPEVAAVLDVLSKEVKKHTSKGDGKRAQRGAAQDNDIEIAITRALASLQNTSHLTSLISKTNDYGQTLAHFAVIFGYINLLRQLVKWGIDLSIADMNGLTALHCAYKKGDRVSVQLLLENGASETVLDNLGRAPRHLMSGSSNDYDTSTSSDDKSEMREPHDGISLSHRNDLEHETIDADDGMSVDGPDRGFREWVDQMDNHTPVESMSKAAASCPMGRVQYTPGRRTFRLPYISIDPNLNPVLIKESGIKEDPLNLACMTHVTPEFSWPPTDARPVLSARHKSRPIKATLRPYATLPYRKARRPPAIYSSDIQVVVERCRADGGEENVICLLQDIFSDGISEKALTRKMTIEEARKYDAAAPTQVYRRFLREDEAMRFHCRLCAVDADGCAWKNPRDALRHLKRDHFGLGHTCEQW